MSTRGAQHAEPGERERCDRHAVEGGTRTSSAGADACRNALEACADE